MLSTVNQHKSRITSESVRSNTLVNKAACRFPLYPISKQYYSKLGMSIVLAMGTALAGCGGGGSPTTRTDPSASTGSTVRSSYNLTIQSPVLLKNVRATATDTATGDLLGQAIIQNGNDILFAIPLKYLKAGNVILLTLSPIDSSSQYYDPMLNHELGAITTFNKSLHALVSLNTVDTTAKVDPFSEIVYERTLIRSGTLSIDKPQFKALTINQLTAATNELTISLGTTSTTPFSILFNSPENITAIKLYQENGGVTSVNQQASSTLIALAQLALFAQNNPTVLTPYLDFATRASLDLQDGDLDGMTIFGGETAGTVQISNPILYSGITSVVNTDPDHTDVNSLITVNTDQRNQRGVALKQATTQYFQTLNASVPLQSRTDNASLDYIQNFDFGIFAQAYTNYGYNWVTTTPLQPSSRIGAGNYTRAFGLPTGTDFKKALDASDLANRSNDIMQLNGTYVASNGCKLEIGYDGTINLSQGALNFQVIVNRKFNDSLTRLSDNNYVLNVTSADITAPRFIQIRTIGAQIISAEAGRSSEAVPMTLDTSELKCMF